MECVILIKKHFILKLLFFFQNEMQFDKNPKVHILHLHFKITKSFQEHIMQLIYSFHYSILGHSHWSLKEIFKTDIDG